MAIQQMLLGSGVYTPPPGQQAYTTPGTYNFAMPAGIDSVSAVVVAGAGGGAAAYGSTNGGAGGGGGLSYGNNITWSSATAQVVVGAGGAKQLSGTSGNAGANSSLNGNSFLRAEAGGRGNNQSAGWKNSGLPSK